MCENWWMSFPAPTLTCGKMYYTLCEAMRAYRAFGFGFQLHSVYNRATVTIYHNLPTSIMIYHMTA